MQFMVWSVEYISRDRGLGPPSNLLTRFFSYQLPTPNSLLWKSLKKLGARDVLVIGYKQQLDQKRCNQEDESNDEVRR